MYFFHLFLSISKRRLENYGEEDQFYMKDHHEPIVSEEVFVESYRQLCNDNKNILEDFMKRLEETLSGLHNAINTHLGKGRGRASAL